MKVQGERKVLRMKDTKRAIEYVILSSLALFLLREAQIRLNENTFVILLITVMEYSFLIAAGCLVSALAKTTVSFVRSIRFLKLAKIKSDVTLQRAIAEVNKK